MFIDTSAFVAIFRDESDAPHFRHRIQAAAIRLTSGLVRLESCMVLAARLDRSPVSVENDFDLILREAVVAVVPITDVTGRLAVDAFERYGKGRGSKAQLNLADCMSYACAKEHGVPILFKGRDFGRTDLQIAR